MAKSSSDVPSRQRSRVTVERIGNSREPVITIDAMSDDPQSLVDYAARSVTFRPASETGSGYPGLLAPLPDSYALDTIRTVQPLIERAFGLHGARVVEARCNFALATTHPSALRGSQRIPHVDTTDPLRFAFLQYLCPEGFGGTAFFRHRSSGTEVRAPDDGGDFDRRLAEELRSNPATTGYITGDTPLFTRIAQRAARFNRLIVYRSALLHSGIIDRPERLTDDPRTGRLTANIFVQFAPVHCASTKR